MKTRTVRELKELIYKAFRYRASLIGSLQSCLCAYPLEVADTETGHDRGCPAHRMGLYNAKLALEQPEKYPPLAVITVPAREPGPICPQCKLPTNVEGATCPECQPAIAFGGAA